MTGIEKKYARVSAEFRGTYEEMRRFYKHGYLDTVFEMWSQILDEEGK
jgi:hypothetical protein